MGRVAFFVDGFNLYHALDNPIYRTYKWLNLWTLAGLFLTKHDAVEEVLYFTTLATWDPGKVARHRLYIKAQENYVVKTIFGEFKRKDKKCRHCHQTFSTFEEKQTDVNIALHLFDLAIRERYDKAIIISGDTDLIPAIKTVRAAFPGKQIGVIIPIGRASEDLKKQADFHHKMRVHHLQASRLPNLLTLLDKTTIECPPNWR
jgi:uncharacterized LabA/DUF88 family protein